MKTPENCYCDKKTIGMCVPCAIQERIVAGEDFGEVIQDFPKETGSTCLFCGGDPEVAKIAQSFGLRPDVAFAKVNRLEKALAEIRDEYLLPNKTEQLSVNFYLNKCNTMFDIASDKLE